MQQITRKVAQVRIGDEEVSYSHLNVWQRMQNHHSFEIQLKLHSRKDSLASQTKKLLGEKIEITFLRESILHLEPESSAINRFVGIVREVRQAKSKSQGNLITVRGAGLSLLMDDGAYTQSFTEKSLNQIIDHICQNYQGNHILKNLSILDGKPSYQEPIDYIVQYQESGYEFLKRMCAQFGEWFYYDGCQFKLGKPDEKDAITLHYNEELWFFDLSTRAIPTQIEFGAYDYLKDEFPKYAPDYQEDFGKFGEIVLDKAKNAMYKGNPTPSPRIHQRMSQKDIEMWAKRYQADSIQSGVALKGVSTHAALKIGSVVTVENEIDTQTEELGKYVITGIIHEINDVGEDYRNQFEAIPYEVSSPPFLAEIRLPQAEPQVATVMDTNDEIGLGRVKVQFPWQKGSPEQSPWIRVIAPYVGGDKGFYIIPDVGDRVWVNFEAQDPTRPYIQGSFYHKNAKPASFDQENNIRSLVTKGGNKVELIDKRGEEKITISNPNGDNQIVLCLGPELGITLQTKGHMTFQADKGMIFNAKEDINFNTGKSFGVNAQALISLIAKTLSTEISENLGLQSNNFIVNATDTIVMDGNKGTINTQTLKLVGSNTASLEGGVELALKAMMILLNS